METQVKKYNDLPVKLMLYPAILFLVIGMFIGVFLAFNAFVFPDYFSGEYVTFGRVRPSHVHGVGFLWLLSAGVALVYYFVPRLCGVSLALPKVAYASCALWWLSLVVSTFSFPLGTNEGWEYAEVPMWIGLFSPKLIFTFSFVLLAICLFATVANRVYKHLYVSIWYAIGAILWTALNAILGFFLIWSIPEGINRMNTNFFYVHNLVGLSFTPLGVAAAYYFIPKAANAPLYSRRLSMIGFWTIAFTYPWVGAHHIIHGPVAQWLQTVSIVFSISLIIPVWTVVFNLFATMKGHWDKFSESVALRFLLVGNVYYLLVTLQGTMQALRNVNEITSKTDWIIGHAHMALLGAFTFFAIGGIYQMLPNLTGKKLWSQGLADLHFTLFASGSILFFGSLFIGGYMQGLQWAQWANGNNYLEYQHNLAIFPFLYTIGDMWFWWILRGIGGVILLLGSLIFAVNVFNTVMLPEYEEEEALA